MFKLLRRLGRAVVALSILEATSTPAQASISVDVTLRFSGGHPAAALVETMETEAAAIWKAYGVDLQWRSSPAATPAALRLFDVLLDSHHEGEPRGVLGEARLAAGPGNYVAIRLDRDAVDTVLRSVTFEQLAHLGHASLGASDVGRALGRVLAHELGHALLATREHRPTGLMRSAFTGDELLAPTPGLYRLSTAEVARLWSVQMAQPASTPAADSLLPLTPRR